MKTLPYDFSETLSIDSSTENISWPTTADQFRSIINLNLRGLIDLAANSENNMHSSALLMSLATIGPVWAYCEKALCVQREIDTGIRFTSASTILPYLRGETSIPDNVGTVPVRLLQPSPPRHPFVRSVINTSRLTNWWKFPLTLVMPEVEVGSDNSLLTAYSLRENSSSVFRDCNHALLDIRRSATAEENPALEDLVTDQLEHLVIGNLHLEAHLAKRLAALVRHQVRPFINLIVRDLSCLQKAKKIPQSYWGGSGGKYSSRLMSFECLRRGGNVTHFDHAGTLGFLNLPEVFAAVELSPSSQYVMATERHAELAKATGAPELVAPVRPVEIIGGPGYTYIRDLKLTTSTAPTNKPTVMYLSSFSNSETKSATHYLSQIIYQDWSIRLARALSALPVNLVCKPHPDFKYPGPRHPIAQFATVINLPFEDVINEADVFIYDCFNSTTFWEAVCTDKRIVCIDVGLARPTDAARPILERRCTFIQARFDDNNRLQIDEAALEDAILGPAPRPLPDELRDILVGP